MAIRLEKPWRTLDEMELRSVKGQLGVYELADKNGNTVRIGYAGGKSLFGLQGELQARIGDADAFRLEVTTAYLTRFRELLMAYYADHGNYPVNNTIEETGRLGRLSPL